MGACFMEEMEHDAQLWQETERWKGKARVLVIKEALSLEPQVLYKKGSGWEEVSWEEGQKRFPFLKVLQSLYKEGVFPDLVVFEKDKPIKAIEIKVSSLGPKRREEILRFKEWAHLWQVDLEIFVPESVSDEEVPSGIHVKRFSSPFILPYGNLSRESAFSSVSL